ARGRFQLLAEKRGGVDEGPREEGLENGAAAAPEVRLGHPCVFPAYLALVLVEAIPARAEDGEVDVDEEARIPFIGHGIVLRGEDQFSDGGLRRGRAAPAEHGSGQRGALRLVVMRARIVDRVVKEEGERDLSGVPCKSADALKPGEAFLEVAKRVIGAMRLAI